MISQEFSPPFRKQRDIEVHKSADFETTHIARSAEDIPINQALLSNAQVVSFPEESTPQSINMINYPLRQEEK